MSRQRMWTDEEISEVGARVLNGASYAEVAAALGRSEMSVRKLMQRLKRRGPSGNPDITEPANVHTSLELHGQSTLVTLPDGTRRWDKTGRPAEVGAPIPEGFSPEHISVFGRPDGTEIARWTSYDKDAAARFEDRQAQIREFMAEHVRPAEPLPAPLLSLSDDRRVFYPLGDPHVGMLAHAAETGKNHDLKIAVSELTECMRQLVALSPAARSATICNLGDFWHAQNQEQRTPKGGHKLDVDGRFPKVARVGLDLYVALVDAALRKHERVRTRNLRGNHDPEGAVWISEFLRAWYRNEPRVEVCDDDRFIQFEQFGQNLVLWAHGDGFPVERIPEALIGFGSEYVSGTKFRFAWTGHVHSRHSREFNGILWESFNTLASKDAWAALKAYASLQRLQAICLHREWGEESRVTVGVERVHASLRVAA